MLRESAGRHSALAEDDVMSHCELLNQLSLRSAGNREAGTRGPVLMVSPSATITAQIISIGGFFPFSKQTKIDPNCRHCINF